MSERVNLVISEEIDRILKGKKRRIWTKEEAKNLLEALDKTEAYLNGSIMEANRLELSMVANELEGIRHRLRFIRRGLYFK